MTDQITTRTRRRVVPEPQRKLVRRTKPEPARTVRLFLSIKHTVNGIAYGPGAVEVPADLGRALAHAEERNIAEERGLSQPRAAIIGAGGRMIPVPPETFDDPDAFTRTIPPTITQAGGQR